MPYIKKANRDKVDAFMNSILTDADGSVKTIDDKYRALVTGILYAFVAHRAECYQTYNDIIGAVHGSYTELCYRFGISYSFGKAAPLKPEASVTRILNTDFGSHSDEIFQSAGDLNYALTKATDIFANDIVNSIPDCKSSRNIMLPYLFTVIHSMYCILLGAIANQMYIYETQKRLENGDCLSILSE